MTSTMPALLSEARFLLHRVGIDGRLQYLETSRDLLSRAPFIDGRTQISLSPSRWDVAAHDAASLSGDGYPDRFLLHVAFCGSTLLARLLDIPGKCFSYKEPQALVDLADIQAARRKARIAADPSLARLVRQQLRKRWAPAEATVVKPSNWSNTLLGELLASDGSEHAAWLDIDLFDFLLAIFRGGRNRMEYILRFLMHMQQEFPDYEPLIRDAAPTDGDSLSNVARLSALALHLQRIAFIQAGLKDRRLSYRSLLADPAAELRRAAKLLDLPLESADIDASVARHASQHSKSFGETFDVAAHAAAEGQILTLYGNYIADARRWAAAALGMDD